MLSLVGNLLGFFTKVIPMLFAWKAGKSSAEKAVLEQASEIVEKANEVEREGRVEKSINISRGLLEFSIHPESAYSQKENLDFEP